MTSVKKLVEKEKEIIKLKGVLPGLNRKAKRRRIKEARIDRIITKKQAIDIQKQFAVSKLQNEARRKVIPVFDMTKIRKEQEKKEKDNIIKKEENK